VNACARPLDPLDAEAVASGSAPIHASDAADHARQCQSCAHAVSRAAAFARVLDELSPLSESVPEPADRTAGSFDLARAVVRLRPFSRRERFAFALWRGPLTVAAGLFLAGLLLVVLPGLSAGEQGGLALGALASLAAVLRAASRSIGDLGSAAPSLDALGSVLRGQAALGLACLLALAPSLWGLTRALARARRR